MNGHSGAHRLADEGSRSDPDRMQAAMGKPVQRIAFIRAPDDVRIELVER